MTGIFWLIFCIGYIIYRYSREDLGADKVFSGVAAVAPIVGFFILAGICWVIVALFGELGLMIGLTVMVVAMIWSNIKYHLGKRDRERIAQILETIPALPTPDQIDEYLAAFPARREAIEERDGDGVDMFGECRLWLAKKQLAAEKKAEEAEEQLFQEAVEATPIPTQEQLLEFLALHQEYIGLPNERLIGLYRVAEAKRQVKQEEQ